MLHLTEEGVTSAYRQIFERSHALVDVWPVRVTLLESKTKGDVLVIKHVSSNDGYKQTSGDTDLHVPLQLFE